MLQATVRMQDISIIIYLLLTVFLNVGCTEHRPSDSTSPKQRKDTLEHNDEFLSQTRESQTQDNPQNDDSWENQRR